MSKPNKPEAAGVKDAKAAEAKVADTNKKAAQEAPLEINTKVPDEKLEDGSYRATPKSKEELAKADAAVRHKTMESPKMVMARSLTGGTMYHFESDTHIGDRHVEVPYTPWLQMQIDAKKVQLRED